MDEGIHVRADMEPPAKRIGGELERRIGAGFFGGMRELQGQRSERRIARDGIVQLETEVVDLARPGYPERSHDGARPNP